MPGFNIRPANKSIASALSLAATYGNVGSAPTDIAGGRDLSLKLAEVANLENAVVKFFVSPDDDAPATTTGMWQVTSAAGVETEVTITQNTSMIHNLAITGKWLWLQGKGAVGANADLTSSLQANFGYDEKLWKFTSQKIPFSAAAVTVGASATQIGSVLDIRGLGDLTLYVTESGGVNGVITVYFGNADSRPADTASMTAYKNASSAAITFTTLLNEKAAHFIGNLCADWIAITATGQNSALLVDLYGTLNGFHG